MADNVPITAGSGTPIATDDVAGVHYQEMKLVASEKESTQPLSKAEDAAHQSGDHGIMALGVRKDTAAALAGTDGDYQPSIYDASGRLWVNPSGVTQPVGGDVAHDAADSGNPVKVGGRAVAHGANPTAVAAADRADLLVSRAGIPWVIGGHPNVKTAVYLTTGAQTDDTVLAAIATGTKYVITRVTVTLDEATTVGVAVRLGFGATTLPALPASGNDAVDGLLVYHPGMVPGSGMQLGDGSGILGVGGDGEELRITNEAPTSGTLVVAVSYYTIES